jgi:uncharacterized protein YbbK (DUF523 family)
MTSPREPVLVSACLLGLPCRYDGRDNRDQLLADSLAERNLEPVGFCPEQHGGLSTPRPPAWIEKSDAYAVLDGRARVVDHRGNDVSAAFLRGADGALEFCRARGIVRAFLKERSPSCGVVSTHVDGQPVDGPGVTTAALERGGVSCEGIQGRRSQEE